jgi:hypothetical protein
MAAIISTAPESSRKLLEGILEKKLPSITDRRSFLSFGLRGGIFALGAYLIADSDIMGILAAPDTKNMDPTVRVLKRLQGIYTNANTPGNADLFTRNAIMGLKTKAFAEYLKKQSHEPTVVFNVGAAHSGIEDMIQLPSDTLRLLIATYNKAYVGKITQQYGKDIAHTRILGVDDQNQWHDVAMLEDTHLLHLLKLPVSVM